ncbi:hypothetical protein CQ065_08240 [Pseudomonas sp. MYb187]|nr:hypothetical protein CQ065_08240 [Pseudomonas sp. MYb187]
MPHCRRFLGVNSVTNLDPDKGVMPVPIIRNEYWFEKFSFCSVPVRRPALHPFASQAQGTCKASRMRRFPFQ